MAATTPPVPQVTAAMNTKVRPRATGVAKAKDTDHSTVVAQTRTPGPEGRACGDHRRTTGRVRSATPRASGDRRRGAAVDHGGDASRRPRRSRRHSRGPGYRDALGIPWRGGRTGGAGEGLAQ